MQALQRDPLPENFRSLEEFWTFWDSHSTADYEDFMEDEKKRGLFLTWFFPRRQPDRQHCRLSFDSLGKERSAECHQ